MSISRLTAETVVIRREYTEAERLEMGRELAQAHNRIAAIDDEEKVMKASVKEKRSGIELSIGSISRKLNDGYEMASVRCALTYDFPNVGEVTYYDPDGKIVKQRAMTVSERQEELPFTDEQAAVVVENSAAAVEEFFDAPPGAPSAKDLDAVAEEQAAVEATSGTENDAEPVAVEPAPKPSGRKPRGFEKPLNPAVDEKW